MNNTVSTIRSKKINGVVKSPLIKLHVTFNKTYLNFIYMLTTPQMRMSITGFHKLNYELSIRDISFSFIAHNIYKSLMPRSCD